MPQAATVLDLPLVFLNLNLDINIQLATTPSHIGGASEILPRLTAPGMQDLLDFSESTTR